MKKPFKKLFGRAVLLDKPVLKESIIKMTEEVQKSLDIDAAKKWEKLEVFAIGNDVTGVEVGDRVLIKASSLSAESFVVINDEPKILISEYDIILVW